MADSKHDRFEVQVREYGEVATGSRSDGLTRRTLLGRGAGASAFLAGSALLAACGSSSPSSASSSSASSSTAPTSTAATSGATPAPPSSGLGAQLRDILALPTGKAAGQGLTIKLGGDFALSGEGTSYGLHQYHGALLGVAAVKAAGGPDFDFIVRNTPASVSAGVANTREFGTLGVPAVITSQGGGGGGGAPFYAAYKMWAIDCGGASLVGEKKPFLYQGRAEFDAGFMPTILAYTKAKRPQVKRFSFLTYAIAGLESDITTQTVDLLKSAGYQIASPVTVPLGVTDFTPAFAAIAPQKPDLILSGIVEGSDDAVMLKQYPGTGIGVKFVGTDYTPTYAELSGPLAIKAYEFCFDYFNAASPGNDWAKLFVSEYKSAYGGATPIYYDANYYQAVFWVWELVRRIIAAGGDPTKQGDAYVNAINENPNFPSLYGSPGGAHGTETFRNLATHTIAHKPVAYGQALADGTATIYATADVTGAGFQLTAAGMAAPSSNAATAT